MRDIERAVSDVWDDVLYKLTDILYKYKIEPDDPEFKKAVEDWLGRDVYEAFEEGYEE